MIYQNTHVVYPDSTQFRTSEQNATLVMTWGESQNMVSISLSVEQVKELRVRLTDWLIKNGGEQ